MPKMQPGVALAPALLVFLLAAEPARADVVTLANGDRLTGKVLSLVNGELTLQTEYAGKLKIKRAAIAAIATDAEVTIMRGDGARPERARLGPGGVPLAEVRYVNPPPEISGRGASRKGRVSVSATRTSGNSDTERLYGEASYTARARDWRYRLSGSVNEGKDAGRKYASAWLAGGNYDWFLDESKFLYARGSFEHDQFKDIDLRSAVGGGMGLQLIDTRRTQLVVRGGLDTVSVERFTAADESYAALGWGIDFSHWVWDKRVELFHEQQGFWNLEDTRRTTLLSKTGLRLPVAEGLTANAQLNLDWERRPAAGRKSTDATLLFGVGYDW